MKKEMICLTNDLIKCYDSRAKFNYCWTSQKFTLNKQGLGYIPKKGKKAFYETKTVFVKKMDGHIVRSAKSWGIMRRIAPTTKPYPLILAMF